MDHCHHSSHGCQHRQLHASHHDEALRRMVPGWMGGVDAGRLQGVVGCVFASQSRPLHAGALTLGIARASSKQSWRSCVISMPVCCWGGLRDESTGEGGGGGHEGAAAARGTLRPAAVGSSPLLVPCIRPTLEDAPGCAADAQTHPGSAEWTQGRVSRCGTVSPRRASIERLELATERGQAHLRHHQSTAAARRRLRWTRLASVGGTLVAGGEELHQESRGFLPGRSTRM